MEKTLIDNSEQRTMQIALHDFFNLPDLRTVRIATGYWDLKGLVLVKASDNPRELVDDFNSDITEDEFAQKLATAREKAPKAVEYLLRLIKKQVLTEELVAV